MNVTITLRLEFPDALTNALNALAVSLAARPASPQLPSPGPIARAQTRPAGGLPASDVSSLTLPAAERAPPPVFLGRPKTNRRSENKWTPDRIAIIRRDWPTGRVAAAITNEVNALPGDPVNPTQVGIYAASRLNLRRPDGFRAHQPLTEALPAEPAALPPQPAAVQQADPTPVPPAVIAAAAVAAAAVAAEPPRLPNPINGKIYASWSEIAAFATRCRIRFDGDMVPINQFAKRLGLLEIVLTEPFGPGSTASALPGSVPAASAAHAGAMA